MAIAFELVNSREGGTRGLFGSSNQTTLWQVTLDAADDDPVLYLKENYVPPGVPFPWPDVQGFASEYTPFHTPDPKTWNVLVNYLPPIVANLQSGWFIEVEIATEGKHALQDRNGVPIGPRAYLQIPKTFTEPDNLGTFTTRAGQLGWDSTRQYKSIVPPTGNPGSTAGLDSSGEFNWFAAGLARKDGRRIKGATKQKRVGTLVLRKIVPNLTDSQLGLLVSANTGINKSTWFGARTGTIQQRGVLVRPDDGQINQTTRIQGIVWNLTLIYHWDEDGIEDETRTIDTVQHPDGTETVATFAGEFGNQVIATPVVAGQASTIMRKVGDVIVTDQPQYDLVDFVGLISSAVGSAPVGLNSLLQP